MAELGVFGVGVAVADAEFREIAGNNKVCTVNLAFNRGFQDKNKEWKNEVCFLRAQVWGKKAEKMRETVKKGTPVYVCGFMKQDSWEDDSGQKKVAFSINLKDFQVCTKYSKTQKSDGKKSAPVGAGQGVDPVQQSDYSDSEIPF